RVIDQRPRLMNCELGSVRRTLETSDGELEGTDMFAVRLVGVQRLRMQIWDDISGLIGATSTENRCSPDDTGNAEPTVLG
ncbi:hypothetical protein P3E18_10305, partial [Pseudomonas aeruginosa]